jgi:hypothetical protein
MQTGAKAESDKMNLSAKQQAEGLRIGADVARTQAQMHHQSAQQAQQPKKESD